MLFLLQLFLVFENKIFQYVYVSLEENCQQIYGQSKHFRFWKSCLLGYFPGPYSLRNQETDWSQRPEAFLITLLQSFIPRQVFRPSPAGNLRDTSDIDEPKELFFFPLNFWMANTAKIHNGAGVFTSKKGRIPYNYRGRPTPRKLPYLQIKQIIITVRKQTSKRFTRIRLHWALIS